MIVGSIQARKKVARALREVIRKRMDDRVQNVRW